VVHHTKGNSMKKLKQREFMYRDYIALALGGQIEVRLPTQKYIDVLTDTHVIELKYARSNETLCEIWAVVTGYCREIEKTSGTRTPIIIPIWSADRCVRKKEQKKYEYEYMEEQKHRSEPVELHVGIIERDVTPVYKIADLEFSEKIEIEQHLAQIKLDFLAAEYLCDHHRDFIACLMEAYRQVHHRKDSRLFTYDVGSINIFGNKMSIHCPIVQGGKLPLDKCVSAFMMLTHYELLAKPIIIDAFPAPVGVVRHDIDKENLPHISGGSQLSLGGII
jgi:hypothetical protein